VSTPVDAFVVDFDPEDVLAYASREGARELARHDYTLDPERTRRMIDKAGRLSTAFAYRLDSEARAPPPPCRAAAGADALGRRSTGGRAVRSLGFRWGGGGQDTWTLHATPGFSERHVHSSEGEVASLLFDRSAPPAPAPAPPAPAPRARGERGGGAGRLMHLLDSEVHIEVTHAEATLWEHGAVHESGPHLGAAFALPEARSTTAALFAAQDRGGYGRAGIDGCLFDAARGIGVAGDWLVETSVEAGPAPSPRAPQWRALLSAGGLPAQGAFISGLALAGRVLEAHQVGPRAPAPRVACSAGAQGGRGGAEGWEKT